MPDYKQTTITGTSWQRAWRVECENPLNGQRSVTYHEERVINVDNSKVSSSVGYLVVPFNEDNASEVFDLRNPETGEVIGTMTNAQLYAALHSHYIHSATKRDEFNDEIKPVPSTME